MICSKCDNKKVPGDAKFCDKCGGAVGAETKSVKEMEFFSIPVRRLIVLTILTIGFYAMYWFYRNWKAVKLQTGEKVNPIVRGIFGLLFCFALFRKIFQSAIANGYPKKDSSKFLAIVYFIFSIIGNILFRVAGDSSGLVAPVLALILIFAAFAIYVVTLWALVRVQKAINFNNSRVVADYVAKPMFTRGEIVITIFGVVFSLLFCLMIFANFMVVLRGGKPLSATINAESRAMTEKRLFIQMVVKMAKAKESYPIDLGDGVTMTNLSARDTAIRYHFLDTSLDGTEDFEQLKKYSLPLTCFNEGIAGLLSENINVEFAYTVPSVSEEVVITYTPADCASVSEQVTQ